MKCPVCGTSALPDDQKKCPRCDSDLEAFYMTSNIEKISKNRLGFGILSSILIVVLIVLWISTRLTGSAADNAINENVEMEVVRLESSLQHIKSENVKLKAENVKLNAENGRLNKQILDKKEEKQKRTKEYVVQNGETLFGIAKKVYGNGFRYVDIAKNNQIEDPTNIRTGQKLLIYY